MVRGWWGVVLAGACGSDQVIGGVEPPAPPPDLTTPDAPPAAWIGDPVDGTATTATTLHLSGFVYDAEDAANTLAAWWTSDQGGLLGHSQPAADGAVSATVVLAIGHHVISLWVRDSSGQAASDVVELDVEAPDTPDEICFDGIDNDLDGTIDEGSVEIHGDGIDQDCLGETRLFYLPVDGPQEYLVPDGLPWVEVKMWGAGGGICEDPYADAPVEGRGGGGGYSDGELFVTAGEILAITVGGTGLGPVDGIGGAGGYGGGGPGGDCDITYPEVDNGGSGGGGASEVSGIAGVITAGGGGGCGWGTVTGTSGAGGGDAGGTPSQLEAGYGNGSGAGGGYGGALGIGGAGGVGHTDGTLGKGNGTDGSATTGGTGGHDLDSPRCRGGGGGGGGFGGGGGGGASESWSAGAGAGGGGRTVAYGTTVAGDSIYPANMFDPDRGDAGQPGFGGLVVLTLPD